LYNTLGVEVKFTNSGIQLKSKPTTCNYFEFDFVNCPDLAQTIAVTLVAKNIPFRLTGLDNLSIKETDRIQALITEFQKMGITIKKESNSCISWIGNETMQISNDLVIETYHDHRMALAFAPLVIKTKRIKIIDPYVVSKSYPSYWDDLREVGFEITEE